MMTWPWLILIGLYGACVGSFLNVVVYRLPEGKSLVRPASQCPRCAHALAWFENVPVLGWLWLRGRCRHCKAPISMQYPLIELLTGLLFFGLAWFYFNSGMQTTWQAIGPGSLWPVLLVQLILAASLLASLLIDARYFIIPIAIPWLAFFVALVVLPVAAWFDPSVAAVAPAKADSSSLHGPTIAMGLGGAVGLVLANLLLWLKIIPRSFPEEEFIPTPGSSPGSSPGQRPCEASAKQGTTPGSSPGQRPCEASAKQGTTPGSSPGQRPCEASAKQGTTPGTVVGVGQVSGGKTTTSNIGSAHAAAAPKAVNSLGQSMDERWLEHPFPRREVLKELLFVAWPVNGMLAALAMSAQWSMPSVWPAVLGHVLLGAWVGGGIVWLVRIAGTLAFGREAMGLGDVHLMMAVGAVLGWVDVLIAFFVAPFIALAFTAAVVGLSSVAKLKVRQIPFGPHLAIAALLVMVVGGPRLLNLLGIDL